MINPLAIQNYEKLCFKCLERIDDLTVITIPAIGYGSRFDTFSSTLQLCKQCHSKTPSDWWKLEIKEYDEYSNEYMYENEILNYIQSLPIQSRELFENRLSTGEIKYPPQEWIDYELGILPHEKCKQYGLFSIEEITAYKTRFPVCENVFIRIWRDGSKGSACTRGAHGDVSSDNLPVASKTISCECFTCSSFRAVAENGKVKDDDCKR